MGVYKTHKEAVLANGSTKGVYTDGERFFTGGSEYKHYDTGICNPAAFLETLESFLASGKRLVSGDYYVGGGGKVVLVSDYGSDDSISEESANQPMIRDDNRFILQAAADQVKTPEEKEAFDAIDTTPHQVEPLSETEWNPKSGQEVYIAQINTLAGVKEERYFVVQFWCNSEHQREYLNCGILFPTKEEAEIKTKTMIGIPIETTEEREERERLESARELYLLSNKVMAGTHMINHYSFQESKDVWLAIVDETSYRKERKQ